MPGPGASWIGEEEKRGVMEVLDSGWLFRYGCGELANRPTSFQSGEITHVEQEHDPVAQG